MSESWTIGVHVTNVGDDTALLTDVSLIDPKGIELLGAILVPPESDKESAIGALAAWPPNEQTTFPITHWKDRQEIGDAVIEPGETWDLGVGVEPTSVGSTGAFQGIEVTYEGVKGFESRERTDNKLSMARDCDGVL